MLALQPRRLLWPLFVGGLIAGASVIAYINSERGVPENKAGAGAVGRLYFERG
jgi:hypothetical protein